MSYYLGVICVKRGGYTKDWKITWESIKKLAKNLQKGVDIKNALWYYIQVDAIRHWNKAKVARHLKFDLSKLNIEPIKKRMCGSSAFQARDQVKLISFNNKSQIGSSKYLTKRNCSDSRKNEESEWDNTLVYRMSLTKFWRRRWQFIEVKNFFGEFDPGSGRTLAACLTHASRTESF